MADAHHEVLPRRGVEGWNRWRTSGSSPARPDLRGADFGSMDLRGADLTVCDLSGANLTGACLAEANLFCADLSGALLTGADLTRSDLRGVDFGEGAHLRRAIFRRSYACAIFLVKADRLTWICGNPT